MSSEDSVVLYDLVKSNKKNHDLLITLTVFVTISLLGTVAIIVLIVTLTDYISSKVISIVQSEGLKTVVGSLGEGVARGMAASLQIRNQNL